MPSDPPAVPPPRVPRAAAPPLVGRDVERVVLAERLAAAVAGTGSVVLLSGEPGAGKTRLLDVAVADALAAGATVLRGGALDAAGMPPYLPFVEALGHYLRSAPADRVAAQLGPFPGPLAAILPEVAPLLAAAGETGTVPPEQERFRLFEAVGDLLAGIARTAPLLLTLDDLHWADASTLDLLVAVARRIGSEPVVVACAYRAGDAGRNPAFGRALADLSRLPAATSLPLSPLGEDAVGALAAALVGAPLVPGGAAVLAGRSGGNPFFAEALVRHWLATGQVAREAGGARVVAPPGAVPTSIRAVLRERLGRLATGEADLLAAAAVLGRSVDPHLLAAATGREPGETEAALLAAVGLHLLRLDPDGGFAFSHDTVREALLADIPPVRRRRLHGAVAWALERGLADAAEPPAARVAYHHVRGGDRERAVLWSRVAAERALRSHAHREAAGHLRDAVALLPDRHPERGTTLRRLGEAELLADDDAAAATFAAAADWFRQQGPDAAGELGAALRRLGDVHVRRERHDEARLAFESALDALGTDPSRAAERARALTRLGALLSTSLHDHRAGAILLEQAVGLADAAGAPDADIAARRALGNLRVRRGDLAAGIALLEEALRRAEAAGDPAEAAECCAALAPARFWQGEVAASAEIARRRLRHAQQTRDPYDLRHVAVWLATCAAVRGQLDEAQARLAEAEAQVARLASPEPRAYLDFVRGALAATCGDLGVAVPLLAAATGQFRAIGPGALVWYLGWLGVAHARRGDRAAAAAVLAELERLLSPIPPEDAPGEPVALAAQIALLLDDRPRLERARPRLDRFAGRFHDVLVDRLRGEIALRLGPAEAASPLLAAAESVARRERLVFELAAVLEARAAHAAAEERFADAAALLEAAAGAVEAVVPALGARHRESAAAARARRPAPAPAGLTRREVEVLREVVAGRSNREIAERLFVTEKTVEHHVSRILAKTDSENRAAAVAFAIRQGVA